MNGEKAIEVVRSVIACLKGSNPGCDHDCDFCVYRQDDDILIDACMVAVDSMENESEAENYRTPKKVEITHGICIHDDETQEIEHNFFCPSCGRLLAVIKRGTCIKGELSTSYCSGCGQALDWSGMEE